jgi:hypothetical protein
MFRHGPLSTLHHGPKALPAAEVALRRGWRDWAAEAFAALDNQGHLPSQPDGTAPDPLARLASQLELLDGALSRFWRGDSR